MNRLRHLVLSDRSLWPRLLATTDRQEFITTLAALALDCQMPIDHSAIDRELVAAQRHWRQRWV